MSAPFLPYLQQNPIYLSYSSRGVYDFCARKFEFYKMMQTAERVYTTSLAAEAGTCIHRAHQEWMRTRNQDAAVFELLRSYPVRGNKDFHTPDGFRSIEACYATLMALINSPKLMGFELAKIKCIDGVERPAIEVPFDAILKDIHIDGRPVVYTGYIDYIFWKAMLNTYITADLKTTRDDSSDLDVKYKYHGQASPYGIVLQHILGQDVTSFDAMYIHTFLDLVEPNVSPIVFPKTQQDVKDWFTGLCFFLRQWMDFERAQWYPRREGGCENQYRDKCIYLKDSVCDLRDRERAQGFILAGRPPEVQDHPVPWISFEIDMPDGLKRMSQ